MVLKYLRNTPCILETAKISVCEMIDLHFISKTLENELGYDKIKEYYHYTKTNIKGTIKDLNLLTEDQLKDCCNKLNKNILNLSLGYYFDIELFKHTFLNPIINCWVIFNKGKITDMISCYNQKSKLANNKLINNCNLFYYFNNKNSLEKLVSIVIKYSIKNNIDRVKVLNIMDYNNLKNFNFDEGLVKINYYIYNWYSKNIDKQHISYFVF